MINNPKEIQEVLNVLDNVTFEQLDEAIKKADERSDYMNEEEIIAQVENLIQDFKEGTELEFESKETIKWYEDRGNALQNLLSMYQQEKEKNKKLIGEINRIERNYDVIYIQAVEDCKEKARNVVRKLREMKKEVENDETFTTAINFAILEIGNEILEEKTEV